MGTPGEGRVDNLREQVVAVLAERALLAEQDDIAAQLRDRLAHLDDVAANARDRAAEARDDNANDPHPAASGRLAAASDRASAQKERGRSRHDRQAAQKDRTRAAADRAATTDAAARFQEIMSQAEAEADDAKENMLLIGQAQGRLMQAHGITAAEALLQLFTRASNDRTELRDAAHSIVTELATSEGAQ